MGRNQNFAGFNKQTRFFCLPEFRIQFIVSGRGALIFDIVTNTGFLGTILIKYKSRLVKWDTTEDETSHLKCLKPKILIFFLMLLFV